MKRVFTVGILILAICAAGFASSQSDFEKGFEDMFRDVNKAVSEAFSGKYHFYTTVGSAIPVNTRSFLGLKAGIGLGVMLSPDTLAMISEAQNGDFFTEGESDDPAEGFANEMTVLFSSIPMPYTTAYFKVGVPEILPYPLKYWDIGVRIGILPNIGGFIQNIAGEEMGGVKLHTYGFKFGVDARTLLVGHSKSILKVEGRVNVDWDNGGIGFNYHSTEPFYLGGDDDYFATDASFDYNMGFKLDWHGFAFGFGAAAGIDLPLLKVYAGLNINFIAGSMATTTYVKGDFNFADSAIELVDLSVTESVPYTPVDLKGFIGIQLLFMNFAAEYSFTSGVYAFTFYPLVLPL